MAVNRARSRSQPSPDRVETGRVSRMVPRRIKMPKVVAMTLVGLRGLPRFFIVQAMKRFFSDMVDCLSPDAPFRKP